jgi:hypothetical protein
MYITKSERQADIQYDSNEDRQETNITTGRQITVLTQTEGMHAVPCQTAMQTCISKLAKHADI